MASGLLVQKSFEIRRMPDIKDMQLVQSADFFAVGSQIGAKFCSRRIESLQSGGISFVFASGEASRVCLTFSFKSPQGSSRHKLAAQIFVARTSSDISSRAAFHNGTFVPTTPKCTYTSPHPLWPARFPRGRTTQTRSQS